MHILNYLSQSKQISTFQILHHYSQLVFIFSWPLAFQIISMLFSNLRELLLLDPQNFINLWWECPSNQLEVADLELYIYLNRKFYQILIKECSKIVLLPFELFILIYLHRFDYLRHDKLFHAFTIFQMPFK